MSTSTTDVMMIGQYTFCQQSNSKDLALTDRYETLPFMCTQRESDMFHLSGRCGSVNQMYVKPLVSFGVISDAASFSGVCCFLELIWTDVLLVAPACAVVSDLVVVVLTFYHVRPPTFRRWWARSTSRRGLSQVVLRDGEYYSLYRTLPSTNSVFSDQVHCTLCMSRHPVPRTAESQCCASILTALNAIQFIIYLTEVSH